MHPQRIAQIVWLYYRQVVSYNLIFTLLALSLYFFYGSLKIFAAMFWLKVLGFAFIGYIYYEFHDKDLYFYYNLGFSRRQLVVMAIIIEVVSFSGLVYVASFLISFA